MRSTCLTLCCLLCCAAAETPLRIDAAGVLHVDDVEIGLLHFAPGWKLTVQGRKSMTTDDGFPTSDGDAYELRGELQVSGGAFNLVQTASGDHNSRTITWQVTSDKPVKSEAFGLELRLPKQAVGRDIIIDGDQHLTLPEERSEQALINGQTMNDVRVPLGNGSSLLIHGQHYASLTDERRWGGGFSLRTQGKPHKGGITSGSASITLSIVDGSMPLEAADPDPKLARAMPMAANEDWQPYERVQSTTAGSALDFSFLLDAPAGKFGPVITNEQGHFVFRDQPEQRIRFYGTNLVYGANFPGLEQAEAFADQLARMGYNIVRFHHIDDMIVDRKLELDEGRMDRLDKFAAALKARGIYLSIDLYSYRGLDAGTLPGQTKEWRGELKGKAIAEPAARENWRAFAERYLNHVNPYTGLAWKDEPALVNLCLINEGNIYYTWGAAKAAHKEAYDAWLAEQGKQESKGNHYAYLTEASRDFARTERDWIRNGLGSHVLVTDTNYMNQLGLAIMRQEYDLVDNHYYWAHPDYMGAWELPWKFSTDSAMSNVDQGINENFPSRLFGKPYTITEFHFVYPNPYRAEGAPMYAAYAAMQDWDGLFRFCHGSWSGEGKERPILYFDAGNDPMSYLGDRIGQLLFVRGDVAPATLRIPLLIGPDAAASDDVLDWQKGRASDAFRQLGMHAAIGIEIVEPGATFDASAYPVVVLGPGATAEQVNGAPTVRDSRKLLDELKQLGIVPKELSRGSLVSADQQLALWSGAQVFSCTTPRTEILALPADKPKQGDALAVTALDQRAVIAASSLTDQPLEQSQRILLLHLTDAQNTGVAFRSKKGAIMTARGEAPVLVRRGTAAITLRHQQADKLQAYALADNGERGRQIPITVADGLAQLQLATIGEAGTTVAYELVVAP